MSFESVNAECHYTAMKSRMSFIESIVYRWRGMPQPRRRLALAGLLFCGAAGGLAVSIPGPGLAWDEPFYLTSGYGFYLSWFGRIGQDAFTREAIQECWSACQWHPPLAQFAIGVTRWLGEDWIGPLLASRMASVFSFAAMVVCIYLFTVRHYGDRAGLLAAFSLVAMPRVFGQAHFAELDAPAACLWFITVAAFVEVLDRPAKWWPIAGVVLGFAWLTKVTTFPLPILLVAWAFGARGKKAWGPCLGLAAAIPVFFLWPLMWIQPIEQIRTFLGTVSARPDISVLYFGRVTNCFDVPWHYPLIMVFTTVPLAILVFTGIGCCGMLRRLRNDRVGVLLLANVLFVLAMASSPWAARYDGVRLFMPVFPFIAVLAGVGLDSIYEKWKKPARPRPTIARVGLLVFVLYHFGWLLLLHPFYLSDYNGLVGGLPGANRLGMETTYWMESVDSEVIRFVNENASPNAAVTVFPYSEMGRQFYSDGGFFRDDLRLLDRRKEANWDWQILVCRRGMFDEEARRLYQSGSALFERKHFGVPLCQVFREQEKASPEEVDR